MEVKFIKASPTENMTLLIETPVAREKQLAVAERLIAYGSVYAEQAGYIEEAEKTDPTAFSGVENTEQRLLLKATLDTLNNDERQIVMLKAVAGMKAREIGKVLEIPLNTVLSKYHRALKKMRLYIEKEDGR